MSRLQAQPPPKVLWLCLDESNTYSSLVVVIQTSGHMAILKPVSFLCHLCLFALCLNYMSNMTGADYSSRAPVFTSGFWWGPVLLITLRAHLCSTPVFDGVRCCSLLFASTCVHFQFLVGVRCCSLLFASTCVHLRFLMGSGVAHYSSRAPVFTSSFWWDPVLLITLREHLCSLPFFDGVRCCS
jgi:hypothetical protein